MKEGIVITVGNSKGGVGKTTISRHLPFSLAKRGFKVLCIDMDTQASLTGSLYITRRKYREEDLKTFDTLMSGIYKGDLRPLIVDVMDNLDFIPSGSDLEGLVELLGKRFGNAEVFDSDYVNVLKNKYEFFKGLIEPLKKYYDFIFIDTPPTASIFTHASAYSSDYVLIAFQTQLDSLKGAISYSRDTVGMLRNVFKSNVDVLGVIPNQLDNNGRIDQEVLEAAYSVFPYEAVFENIIPYKKRIQTVPKDGLSVSGRWNVDVYENVFEPLADEFLEKINLKMEEVENG